MKRAIPIVVAVIALAFAATGLWLRSREFTRLAAFQEAEESKWRAEARSNQEQADAIRALQTAMAGQVARYFDIGADGSFDLDVMLFQATKPAG